MFNINKYNHDAASGIVDIDLEYNVGRGIQHDIRQFSTEQQANLYILSMKRQYLLDKVGNYIDHKNHIAANSKLNFYRGMTRAISEERLKAFLAWGHTQPFIEVCRIAPKMAVHFRNLLPIDSNPSYQSSLIEINNILEFAASELLLSHNI